MYRVIVLLFLGLIAWGLWAVYQVGSAWKRERQAEPEPVPREAQAAAPPAVEPVPVPEPVVEELPSPKTPSEEERLAELDERVRECIRRQKETSLPVHFETLTDRGGRMYQKVAVTRLEPDGIHVQHEGGVDKVDIARLPGELQQRFFLEDEVALRYREVLAEHRAAAARARKAESRDRDRRMAGEAASQKTVRCQMCGGRFPEGQMKTYQALLKPTDKVRRSITCCPSCVPYSKSNIADPYMPR